MKKLLSLILSVAMLLTVVTSVSADKAKNSATSAKASEWATESIEKAAEINLINYGGNYNFPANITREDFCELIYNYCMIISDGPTAVYAKNPFSDTENDHIILLNALGIVSGKSETEFAPNDLLTREEAATILFRLIKTVHPDSAATEMYFEFADGNEISDWATDGIQRICNMGIMNGVGDGKFAPKENFTTEQAVTTLVRCYENFNRGEIIGGADGETEIVVAGSSLPPESTELKFNKPFYFAIRDNTSGEILFMGRYAFAE